MKFSNNKERIATLIGVGVVIGLIFFAVISKYNNKSMPVDIPYENALEKKKILSQMRIHLLKSLEMEKNAVMALTDAESIDFASQSRSASATVEQNMKILDSLIHAIPLQDEKKLLDEFTNCWAEFGKLDEAILELAVENTNLKAANLSRDKGAETIERFEQALENIILSYSGTQSESRVAGLVSHAMIAGLKMYNLHSFHIAEANGEKMDQIEAQVEAKKNEVANSLDALSEIVGAESLNAVSQAKAAFAEFVEVTARVFQLSRLNSNIKSLELSLGRKRKIAAQCDEILASFQEIIQNKTFKATK